MKITSKLLMLFIVIVVLLFLFELILRRTATYIKPNDFTFELLPDSILIKTPIGQRLRPNTIVMVKNHPQSHRDILMSINSLGFRGPEFPTNKPLNEYRILVIGDSITWQDGLNDEETWVRLTEKSLNASTKGRSFRMINGGVGDVGTKEEVDNLTMHAAVVKPDLVVVG